MFIPEMQRQEVSGGTESKHRFRRKGVPCKLTLKLVKPRADDEDQESQTDDGDDDQLDVVIEDEALDLLEDEPWADCPYILEIEGDKIEGTTDSDGILEHHVPPSAKKAMLIMDPGTDEETQIPILIGGVDPISTVSGIKQRLRNLGYGVDDDDDDEESESLFFGLQAFQHDNELAVTGKIDDQTKNKLTDVHGS